MFPIIQVATLAASFWCGPSYGGVLVLAQASEQAPRAAPGPVPGVNSPNQAESMANELAYAERLSIKFRGYQDLTGEYRVNPDQTVSIPVIGRVSLVNMDSAALEKVLAAKASSIAGRETFATVEVAAYRPIYISGFVDKPGIAQWQPGMTVLHAVALSGGVYRPMKAATIFDLSSGGAAKRRKGFEDQKRLVATIARLRAEKEGSDKIAVPPKLISLAGKDGAEEIIQGEKVLLATRLTSYRNKVAGVERGIQLATQELKGLQEQDARIRDQMKLRRDYAKNIRELLAKGLVRAERSLEEELRMSDLEEKITNIAVSIARVQSVLVGLQRDLTYIKVDGEAALVAEIAKLEQELAQVEIELEESRTSSPRNPEENASASQKNGSGISYEIVRRGPVGQVRVQADESTPLTPGDVLVVSQGGL